MCRARAPPKVSVLPSPRTTLTPPPPITLMPPPPITLTPPPITLTPRTAVAVHTGIEERTSSSVAAMIKAHEMRVTAAAAMAVPRSPQSLNVALEGGRQQAAATMPAAAHPKDAPTAAAPDDDDAPTAAAPVDDAQTASPEATPKADPVDTRTLSAGSIPEEAAAEWLATCLAAKLHDSGDQPRMRRHSNEDTTGLLESQSLEVEIKPGMRASDILAQSKQVARKLIEDGATVGVASGPRRTFPQYMPKSPVSSVGSSLSTDKLGADSAMPSFHVFRATRAATDSATSAWRYASRARAQLKWLLVREAEALEPEQDSALQT